MGKGILLIMERHWTIRLKFKVPQAQVRKSWEIEINRLKKLTNPIDFLLNIFELWTNERVYYLNFQGLPWTVHMLKFATFYRDK